MNTMNIPGFTAEDSLYKSRTQYSVTAPKFLAAKADIRPQMIRLPPTENCIRGCVCVSPFGCPCCDSLGWPGPFDPFDPTDPFEPLTGNRVPFF